MVAEARSSAHAAAAALAEVADPQPDLAFDFAMLAELSDAVDEHSLGCRRSKRPMSCLARGRERVHGAVTLTSPT